jgi:hypothetical protein
VVVSLLSLALLRRVNGITMIKDVKPNKTEAIVQAHGGPTRLPRWLPKTSRSPRSDNALPSAIHI